MKEGNEALYPISLLMASVWIWAYALVITFCTFELTIAFNLHFSIVPMLLYPFGIAIRDAKKWRDMAHMI
jgi:hypothetical protein